MAQTKSLDIGKIFSNALNALQKNAVFFVEVILLLALVKIGGGILQRSLRGTGLAFLVSLVQYVLQIVIAIALLKGSLQSVDGKKPKLSTMYDEDIVGEIVNYFAASLISGFLVVIGLIFFILPGIYFLLRYMFATLVVVDKNASFSVALSKSAQVTKGYRMQLGLLLFVLLILNIAGAVVFGLGLLVTVPISTLSLAYAYRSLSKSNSTA